jgi:hypothetical protein
MNEHFIQKVEGAQNQRLVAGAGNWLERASILGLDVLDFRMTRHIQSKPQMMWCNT